MRNEATKILWALLVSTFIFPTGCATTISKIAYSYIAIRGESYLDALNREMREKQRAPSRWSQKRHIGFFGYLKEFEKEIGVKVVIPF